MLAAARCRGGGVHVQPQGDCTVQFDEIDVVVGGQRSGRGGERGLLRLPRNRVDGGGCGVVGLAVAGRLERAVGGVGLVLAGGGGVDGVEERLVQGAGGAETWVKKVMVFLALLGI